MTDRQLLGTIITAAFGIALFGTIWRLTRSPSRNSRPSSLDSDTESYARRHQGGGGGLGPMDL